VPTNDQISAALAGHLGQPLTPERCDVILAACDDYSLAQDSKPDGVVHDRLAEAFCHNMAAVDFMLLLAEIAHTWDDLIDRDVLVPQAAIHRAFTNAVVRFNLNPYFRRYCDRLLPVLQTGILNWHAANALEADGRRECLEVAHVIRCAMGDVALLMAELAGGHEHAKRHAAGLRMLVQQDSLADYLRDMEATHA
jgi:hypothetical protein